MSDEKQAIAQNISLLLSQNRAAEARVELDRLLAMDLEDPESRSLAGDVYAWTGANGNAYKQYNLAADTYNRLGRPDKALGVHHKILDLDTSMMDAGTQGRIRLLTLLVGAEDALVAGQNDKAVAGYSEAIRQFPNHTITYQRLATLFVRLGRHSEAVEQYLTVGRAFYGHGVFPKARPYFERVLELQADQSEALEAVLACLKAEDKEADGIRILKAAVQQALGQGHNEEAAAWFERLPAASRDGATPLGAALLLQSEEVSQAERMVAQLDLTRSEVTDWFKTMGRAALDRGDSLSADVFFRWGSGVVDAVPPTPIAPLSPVVSTSVSVASDAAPVVAALPPPPPPPPEMVLPLPPPGLAAPTGPRPSPPFPLPPAGLGTPSPATPATAPGSTADTPEERTILQTMGEMCLAEEMFEEAKQVFERLVKVDPERSIYSELLNRARAGLGLPPAAAVRSMPAPVAEASPLILPVPVIATAVPGAVPLESIAVPPTLPPLPLFASSEPPRLAEPAVDTPAVEIDPVVAVEAHAFAEAESGRPQLEEMGHRGHSPAKGENHVERPAVEWGESPYAVGPGEAVAKAVHAAEPSPPLPLPVLIAPILPVAPVVEFVVPVPKKAFSRWAAEPVMKLETVPAGTSKIVRTAFTVQLGELPPALSSAVDDQDEIIE